MLLALLVVATQDGLGRGTPQRPEALSPAPAVTGGPRVRAGRAHSSGGLSCGALGCCPRRRARLEHGKAKASLARSPRDKVQAGVPEAAPHQGAALQSSRLSDSEAGTGRATLSPRLRKRAGWHQRGNEHGTLTWGSGARAKCKTATTEALCHSSVPSPGPAHGSSPCPSPVLAGAFQQKLS